MNFQFKLLLEISKTKNKNPLPPIKYHSGIRLPPDRFCLHAPNYTVKTQTVLNSFFSTFNTLKLFIEHFMSKKHHVQQAPMHQQQEQQSAASKQAQMLPNLSFSSLSIKRPRNDEDDYDT